MWTMTIIMLFLASVFLLGFLSVLLHIASPYLQGSATVTFFWQTVCKSESEGVTLPCYVYNRGNPTCNMGVTDMYYKLPSVRIARCYFPSGILYMTGNIFHPHPHSNSINTNTNPNPNPKPNPNNTSTNLNPNPNNPNHNHTPRMENSLEQMQSSVPGDGKCHLRCTSANAKFFAGWRAEIPIDSLDGRSATVVQLSWRKSHNWRTIP